MDVEECCGLLELERTHGLLGISPTPSLQPLFRAGLVVDLGSRAGLLHCPPSRNGSAALDDLKLDRLIHDVNIDVKLR